MGRSYTEKTGRQTGYAVARARKMAAEARLSELHLREVEGDLVPIEHVRAIEAARRAELRARILSVPGKWAPQVVGLRNVAAAQARLEDVMNDLLQTLRETGAAIRDRIHAGEDPRRAPDRRRRAKR